MYIRSKDTKDEQSHIKISISRNNEKRSRPYELIFSLLREKNSLLQEKTLFVIQVLHCYRLLSLNVYCGHIGNYGWNSILHQFVALYKYLLYNIRINPYYHNILSNLMFGYVFHNSVCLNKKNVSLVCLSVVEVDISEKAPSVSWPSNNTNFTSTSNRSKRNGKNNYTNTIKMN